ncbi:hypothetical protein J4E89_004755 [Alternaria sp. Ai002NY15]|nr:hypothetical protein J4E89_004755 [Alternaria sp. Ai002NY15]
MPVVPRNVVAVKKLLLKNRNVVKREMNVLQNLSKAHHAHHHLVTLLATYQQRDYLCLIFPWADADLDQYWEWNHPRSLGDDEKLSAWLTHQCYGLAEAVSQIHRYKTLSNTSMPYNNTSGAPQPAPRSRPQSSQSPGQRNPKSLFGRHGDIKPSNILWYPPGSPAGTTDYLFGILKLSDFGTTQFSDNEQISVQDRKTVPRSTSYQSPECQLDGGELSSQCDVWALGCVFLEFMCWYFGGYERLRHFEADRNRIHQNTSYFFIPWNHRQSNFAELKPPVIEVSASATPLWTEADDCFQDDREAARRD